MTEQLIKQITPRQCAAARVILGWTQGQLAEASRTSVRAISNFEASKRTPRRATIDAIEAAFYIAGVRVLPSGGIDIEQPQWEGIQP